MLGIHFLVNALSRRLEMIGLAVVPTLKAFVSSFFT